MEKIVAKQFKNDITMGKWLSDAQNLENLKIEYPPSSYHAEVNLTEKQILVWSKAEDKS